MHTAGCLSVVSEHPVFLSTFFDDDEVFDNPKEVKDEWCLTGLRWNLPLSVLDCCPIVSFGVIYQDCSDAIGLDSNAQRDIFGELTTIISRSLSHGLPASQASLLVRNNIKIRLYSINSYHQEF